MEEFCQLLTVGGRRDALLEDLHTVLCTIELSMARWADSVCVLQQYVGMSSLNCQRIS